MKSSFEFLSIHEKILIYLNTGMYIGMYDRDDQFTQVSDRGADHAARKLPLLYEMRGTGLGRG